jgi:hypothetical protein
MRTTVTHRDTKLHRISEHDISTAFAAHSEGKKVCGHHNKGIHSMYRVCEASKVLDLAVYIRVMEKNLLF